jgi:hypothetical protein
MAIPEVRHHLEQLLATEAIPTLREIPGHPASDYAETVCYAGSRTPVSATRSCAFVSTGQRSSRAFSSQQSRRSSHGVGPSSASRSRSRRGAATSRRCRLPRLARGERRLSSPRRLHDPEMYFELWEGLDDGAAGEPHLPECVCRNESRASGPRPDQRDRARRRRYMNPWWRQSHRRWRRSRRRPAPRRARPIRHILLG